MRGLVRSVAPVLGLLSLAAVWPAAAADRSVALILDASGSMRAKLPGGITRIEAAKGAIATVVGKLPDSARLSLRAYGHQSPTAKKDCNDTRLLVGFGEIKAVRSAVIAAARGVSPHGYTLIAQALQRAAGDMAKEDVPRRIIVLVSDGKQTCPGDPCATAKALADADVRLTIHTVGLAVDLGARYQLQCIARVARGSYFAAGSERELADAIGTASLAAAGPPAGATALAEAGRLAIRGAIRHDVLDPETGERVAVVHKAMPEIALKPGIYNVRFGTGLIWKSIEVRAGATTTLNPGRLAIEDPAIHNVLDPESREHYAVINRDSKEIPVVPGAYAVSFDKALWRGIEVGEGERRVLKPARLRIEGGGFHSLIDPRTGAKVGSYTNETKELAFVPGTFDVSFENGLWRGVSLREGEVTVLRPGTIKADAFPNDVSYTVFDASGKEVAALRSSHPEAQLPPGAYRVDVAGRRVSVVLKESQVFEIKAR